MPPGFTDTEDKNADLVPGMWRTEVEQDTGHHPVARGNNSNAAKKSAKDVRDALKDFFNSTAGAVPWQNEYVNK